MIIEADVKPDGTYDLFPRRWGRGWRPADQEFRRYLNRNKPTAELFNDPRSLRWRSESCERMAPLIEHFGTMRGDLVNGRIVVRADAYKPYPHWAWEVIDVKYFIIADTFMDAFAFKLAVQEKVNFTLAHFGIE